MRAALVCPSTNYVVDFEAPGTESSLPDIWDITFELQCPVCRAEHSIGGPIAYKQGVMSAHECPIEDATILH